MKHLPTVKFSCHTVDIITCYLEDANKISPYLMPTFVSIYMHMASSKPIANH